MRPLLVLAAASFAISRLTLAASTGSAPICEQLAAQVRQSTTPLWKSDPSLSSWVTLTKPDDPRNWGADEVVAYRFLRHVLKTHGQLDVDGPDPILELEHLAGTPLYMGSTLAGTAECQSSVFAELGPQASGRALPQPEGYTTPCWNVHGDLGRVSGSPAYIESGTVTSTTDDRLIRITPWEHGRWGRACRLTVRWNYRFERGRQFCGDDPGVCHAASAVAVDVARQYFAYRQHPTPPMLRLAGLQPVPDFRYGNVTTPQENAAVMRAWRILAARQPPPFPGVPPNPHTSVFPTFGYKHQNTWDYSFADVDFAIFPLMLKGRLYLGAVGHEGWSWREDSRTLFAVYTVPDSSQRQLTPLAGFAVDRIPDGLKEADVTSGAPAVTKLLGK